MDHIDNPIASRRANIAPLTSNGLNILLRPSAYWNVVECHHPYSSTQLHPLVPPQVSHLRHVPLRTRVKLPHSRQLSPS
jgi:hypothetical protein